MTDLATFLLARIAEDEEVARAARASNGQWQFVGDQWPNPSKVVEWGADVTPVGKSSLDWDRHRHIARHDPARVIGDCEARRRLLQRFPAGGNSYGNEILRLLALPYADHPDYQQEWKP